jgi:S-adenosylmethionine:tRNA ribosyltransferase-isomerase
MQSAIFALAMRSPAVGWTVGLYSVMGEFAHLIVLYVFSKARLLRVSEIDQYDYELPRGLIAQFPLPHRVDARLLVVDRQAQSLSHRHIRDLPEVLLKGDCLVLNDTRVVPARLVGFRATTGGHWEGLFLESSPEGLWRLMCRTRGRLVAGEAITIFNAQGHEDIRLVLVSPQSDGVWVARPESTEGAFELLERIGRVPLPPYIRKGEMVDSDRQNYQTVFAREPGAVAAPTAGLHFTEALLRRLEKVGVGRGCLTLRVGAGTFRPMVGDRLAEHRMHSEWACLGKETIATIRSARQHGGRVIAVGTTTVRVLETAARDGELRPFEGMTDLFIRPPYQFRAVDALLTNFHLPRTTLLVLARTFGGDELISRAYQEAIREEYRFFSYGDAMLIL